MSLILRYFCEVQKNLFHFVQVVTFNVNGADAEQITGRFAEGGQMIMWSDGDVSFSDEYSENVLHPSPRANLYLYCQCHHSIPIVRVSYTYDYFI